MNARGLLAEAGAAGMIVTRDGDQLKVIRPKSEVTDRLLAELKARKPEILAALAPCCGNRFVPNPADYADGRPLAGVDPAELVGSCQLCPASPTYWRST